MLPILRTISVGGVLLALIILALALSPPGGATVSMAVVERPAHGALIDRAEHPEWRQFLILAALRRSEEIGRLRDLPDAPERLPEIPSVAPDYVPAELSMTIPQSAPPTTGPIFAGLPNAHKEIDFGDETGSINASPDATMPIEIGEPSSTELPVQPAEDNPPVTGISAASAPFTETPATEPPDTAEPAGPVMPPMMALAPPEHADPIIVVIRKPTIRHRAAKRAPALAPQHVDMPPPFNFFQALFASFARKPEEPPAKAVRKIVARPGSNGIGKQAVNAPRQALARRGVAQ